jgi:hypothetical protein
VTVREVASFKRACLHGPDGRLTPEADALHRGERLIDWGG